MSFSRPELTDISDRVQSDFVSRLSLTGAILRRSLVYVTSRVIAGAVHMLHGHLDWLSRQMLPDTAEEAALLRWGTMFGVERIEATYATGDVTFTGTNTTVIPAGTVITLDGEIEYETDADGTVSGGTVTIAVTATETGEDGNLDVGTTVYLTSPITGIDSDATVAAGGLTGGADEEDLEDYRARVLERIADPSNGGNDADYAAWAKMVAGVTRAWVYPLELGPGTVLVYFVRDDDAGPIPSVGEVAEVQAVFDEEAPAHATVTAAAPTASALAYTVAVEPDTTAVRAAVTAELDDLHLREAEPGGTLLLSAIRTAIGNAEGLADYTLTTPSADVTSTAGQLKTRGTITWV